MATFVYFIRACESGRIKIGFGKDPYKRLVAMQVGSPEPLEMFGAVEGGRQLETQLHAALHTDRIHGEWFHPTDRVIGAIGELLGWGQRTVEQAESAAKVEAARRALKEWRGER